MFPSEKEKFKNSVDFLGGGEPEETHSSTKFKFSYSELFSNVFFCSKYSKLWANILWLEVSGKRVGMAEIIVMLHSNSTSKIFNVQIHPITVEFSCKLEIIRKCLRSSTVEIIVLLRSNSTSKIFNVRIQPITVEFRCKAEIIRNF